jgi:hypothetical protein
MQRIWQLRKQANERTVRSLAERSPVMQCLGCRDFGAEWQTVVAFDTKTLVEDVEGTICREGPVVIGIIYRERHLSQAPHPMELATVLLPHGIYHPNCSSTGGLCLGHPAPGISLELILHQIWAGLTFNMQSVNTNPGQIVNAEAAVYVRTNAHLFPITRRGLFEQPDEDLRNGDWHARYDPKLHRVAGFAGQAGGERG